MTSSSHCSLPRDQGKQAYHCRWLANACPYPQHSMGGWDWMDGFVWEQIHHPNNPPVDPAKEPETVQ